MSNCFFNGDNFIDRKCLLNYIFTNYGSNKSLVFCKKSYRGSKSINIVCSDEDCQFRIVCRKGKDVKSSFKFFVDESHLKHGIFDVHGVQVGYCNADSKNISTVSYKLLTTYYTQLYYIVQCDQ